MADVFISYSKADRQQAEVLAEHLKLHGYSVWRDDHLYGGDRFKEAIYNAIDAAKVVIVIWSANSVKSEWVRDEAERGRLQRKLIPTKLAKLEDTDIPKQVREQLHIELLDRRDRVLRAVERLAGRRRKWPAFIFGAGMGGLGAIAIQQGALTPGEGLILFLLIGVVVFTVERFLLKR